MELAATVRIKSSASTKTGYNDRKMAFRGAKRCGGPRSEDDEVLLGVEDDSLLNRIRQDSTMPSSSEILLEVWICSLA